MGIRAKGDLVFEDNTIKLRHVELVGGGSRRDVKRETGAGEDGASDVEDEALDGGLDSQEVLIGDFAARGGEGEVGEG